MHARILEVTARIRKRSAHTRAAYLEKISRAQDTQRPRHKLSCGNFAHAIAASDNADKQAQMGVAAANFAIVTAYNDMLSAHAPYADYPAQIKAQARLHGATAQVAGGVPAMCDGVTQGRAGMELSLFSRDVIAMSTAVALSHDVFDGVFCLGICDKIVPGLLIGALSFGHLPAIFVPAGPMPSGLPNAEKVRVRQRYAQGLASKEELLASECASYHSAGTCTFYGTANSNQMFLEIMGLQLPGSSFVNPGTPLRDALTREAVSRLAHISAPDTRTTLADIVNEKSLVNAMIGLLATGGSTNHTIHLNAIARAAGIQINWQDLTDLSAVIPLLCRIYPNGQADVNAFHAAGGMPFLIRELLGAGLLHEDVATVLGHGLSRFTQTPSLQQSELLADNSAARLRWNAAPETSADADVLQCAATPFQSNGGLSLLQGNLGRAVMKVSAVKSEYQRVQAPAKVFHSQHDLIAAFKRGELNQDFIAVVRFQGPKANGMPELHELTPPLGVLQDQGFRVALVTDGRMSGASGKVPAAIHVSPEALDGGLLAKVQDGDLITVDAQRGELLLHVSDEQLAGRPLATAPAGDSHNTGAGRELFAGFRQLVSSAETGATVLQFTCGDVSPHVIPADDIDHNQLINEEADA